MTSDPHHGRRRKYSRLLIDLPLTLWDSSGSLLDDKAMAHDLTRSGIGFETRAKLKNGMRVYFELELPRGEPAAGAARLIWVRHDDWGCWAGANITDIPWRDRRRLKRVIVGPGYDWAGLAWRILFAAFIVVAVLVAEDLMHHHPHAWKAAVRLVPAALIGVGLGMYLYMISHRS